MEPSNKSKDQVPNNTYGGFRGVQAKATGFFRTEQIDGRWWLITPDGNGFISIGMNHFDLAVLKYPDNIHIWQTQYDGSEEHYLRQGISQPLQEWGFNTIGWTEEMVAGEWMNAGTLIRHSSEWSHHQYQIVGMPYCHSLHFVEIEDFNTHPYYPNVFAEDFEIWADYVARRSCVGMAEDPLLIGYTLCPRPAFQKQTEGAWAVGLDLTNGNDLKKLWRTVERYYQVVTRAIKRYDPYHLILGHRFNQPPDTPNWYLEIAKDYTDAILANWWISDFVSVRNVLDRWYNLTGKPILISDTAFLCPTDLRQTGDGANFLTNQRARGEAYQRFASELFVVPYILGWHWCAYIENRVRKSGIRDYLDRPYWDCVNLMKEFNTHQLYKILQQ